MVTRLSVMMVFAFVGPRPVYSWSTSTAEVAIFAEGLWLTCRAIERLSAAFLGRVLGTTRGRGSVGAPQAASSTAYSSGADPLRFVAKLRGFGGGRRRSVVSQSYRTGPRAAHHGQMA